MCNTIKLISSTAFYRKVIKNTDKALYSERIVLLNKVAKYNLQ